MLISIPPGHIADWSLYLPDIRPLFLPEIWLTDLCSSRTYGWLIYVPPRHILLTDSSRTYGWRVSVPTGQTDDWSLFLLDIRLIDLYSCCVFWCLSSVPIVHIADWSLFLLCILLTCLCFIVHIADLSLFLLCILLTDPCSYWTNGWLISLPIVYFDDWSLFLLCILLTYLSFSSHMSYFLWSLGIFVLLFLLSRTYGWWGRPCVT